MNYINIQTLAQHTESEIRALYPNTSFPVPFIAPDIYKVVFPTPQPAYNSITQSVIQITPELTGLGHWEQRWEVVERFATQAEADEAIAADAEANRIASIPTEVTMRQARLALLGAGLLSSVDAAIASLPEPDKSAALIDWEYAAVVQRSSGLVPAMGAALGMTEAQIDDLFIQAATL